MRRTIAGIPFIVISPSFFVLDTSNNDSYIADAQLRYDGQCWNLLVRMRDERLHLREFPNFDAALVAMGGRRAA